MEEGKLNKEVFVNKNSFIFVLLFLFGAVFVLANVNINIMGGANTNITYENNFSHLNLTDGNLVLYMSFDVNSSGTTYDYSNNSNDGALTGGVTFNSTGGVFGGAYKFDGDDDYLLVANDSSLEPESLLTFSTWINRMNNDSYHVIFSKADSGAWYSYQFLIQNGKMRFTIQNQSGGDYPDWIGATILNASEWYHLVVVWEDNTGVQGDVKMYLNGQPETIGTYAANGYSNGFTIGYNSSEPLYIGQRADGAYNFNGSLDEVMIFNRSLSAIEVAQLYNSTYPMFYPVGEILFQDLNFSTNNTVNVSIPGCQQVNGSQLSFKINDGSFANLNSTCMYGGYSMGGNLTNANLTLKFNSSVYQFYSPLLVGNITLNDYFLSSDSIAPTFTTIPANVSGNYLTTSVNADFDFTDETEISMIFINDTSNFTMDNSTGILTNKTPLFVGNYALNVTINDSANNINWTIFTVAVGQSSNNCQVLFNETSPITFPAQFQAYTDCDSAFTFYLNGSAISNDSVVNSGAGTYNISVHRTDVQNYSNTFDDEYFVVSKSTSTGTLYLDHVASSKSVQTNSNVEFNGTLSNGIGNLTLFVNGTEYENNATPVYNLTNFTTEYNYTIILNNSGNANYTSFSQTLYLNVDGTNPQVTIVSPTSSQLVTSSSLSLSATTNENSTCNYSTDAGVTNSSLTANSTGTGHIGTLSSLTDGDYTLNVYCADILGNANNTMRVSFSVSIPVSSSNSDTLNSGGSTTYTPRDEQVSEGYIVKLKKNNKVKLDIKSEEVNIQVKEVGDEEITITVEGGSYTIKTNSSEKIDLDSDGIYDLEISNYGTTLTSLGKKVKLEFKEISEEANAENRETVDENVEVKDKEIKISFWRKIGNFFERLWDWIIFWK